MIRYDRFFLVVSKTVQRSSEFICFMIHAELPKTLGSASSDLLLKSSQFRSAALGLVVNNLGSVILKKVNQLESNKAPTKKKKINPTRAIKKSDVCINTAIRGRLLSTRMSRALGRIFAYCSNSKAVMFHSVGMMTLSGKGFQSRFLKAYKNTSTINATKG